MLSLHALPRSSCAGHLSGGILSLKVTLINTVKEQKFNVKSEPLIQSESEASSQEERGTLK